MIKYVVTRLEQFEKLTGEKSTGWYVAKLDDFLGRFYASLRQKNGEHFFQKKSMLPIRYGLQRYFMQISMIKCMDGSSKRVEKSGKR